MLIKKFIGYVKKMKQQKLRDKSSADGVMMTLWGCFIVLGFAVIALILYKLVFYRCDPRIEPYISATDKTVFITPVRGNIMDCKGRIMATSTLVYEVHMDCVVPHDTLWRNNIDALGKELSKIMDGRSEREWVTFLNGQRAKRSRWTFIGRNLGQMEINRIRKFPIFREGRYRGGYLEKRSEKRLYPYGNSGYRTIGYVKDNSDSNAVKNKGKGIEGAYDTYLHGENGIMTLRKSDYGMIPVKGRNDRKEENGKDVRTTINMDIQNIADEALHKAIERSEILEKSCVIVMETKTGAIRAMVNLGRDSKGGISERENYAIRTAEAPGSIFKTAVLMSMLEEGYVTTIEKEIPTYGGHWQYHGKAIDDLEHVSLKRFPSGKIRIREAFRMSANNPFRQMLCDTDYFGNNPSRFIKKVKNFGLFDTLAFDIPGATPPFIIDPSMTSKRNVGKGYWDGQMLTRIAIGYGMELSPLNLITFYNAIAGNGRMMKPYLVESIEEHGRKVKEFGPVTLHERICSQSTVDTLKRAMRCVVKDEEGTAYWPFKGCVCEVAGKTGTAQRVYITADGKKGIHGGGLKSHQASFVGFFPADNPRYTIITVLWSRPSQQNFYGASYAAPVVREIVDKVYCLDDNE